MDRGDDEGAGYKNAGIHFKPIGKLEADVLNCCWDPGNQARHQCYPR